MGLGGFNLPLQVGGSSIKMQPYVRNSEWISLPNVHATNSEISGLFAVYSGVGNYLALNVSVVGGYTVDWGDGIVENFASGVQANHNHVFSSVNVLTLTTLGHRQALIKVTAQIPGNHFTTVLFNLRHSSFTTATYSTNWLEVKLRTTSACTVFDFHKASNVVLHDACSLFSWVGAFGGTSLASVFSSLRGIEKIDIPNITDGTCSLAFLFRLSNVYNITFGTVTSGNKSVQSMFSIANSIIVAPFFNTSGVINISDMFQPCTALRKIPLYDFSSVTVSNSTFTGCSSLDDLPLFVFNSNTSALNMFSSCTALRKIPAFNFSSCVNMSGFCNGCTSLEEVELMVLRSTGALGSATLMFQSCISLRKLATINLSRFSLFNSAFSGCQSLKKIPNFDLSSSTDVTSMFASCSSLKVAPLLTFGSGCIVTNFFTNSNGIEVFENIDMTNFNISGTSWALNGVTDFKCIKFMNQSFTFLKMNKSSFESAILTPISLNANGMTGSMGSIFTLTNSVIASEAPLFSKSCTLTAASDVIACTNTSSLTVGMQVYGTGTSATTGRAIDSMDSITDVFTSAGHLMLDNDPIVFSTFFTGITVSRIYYIINATANTFKISTTIGGAAFNITTAGTPSFRTPSRILSINTNVSITMDRKQSTSGAQTLSFRDLNVGPAIMRGVLFIG